jgi:DNA-binding LytR/AlgR family response regulator
MESSIKCIIVEDEPVSQAVMEGLVERSGFLQLQASFSDPIKAIHWLTSNPIDLILLDIEMPGLSGIEMLQSLTVRPQVIIISSKEKYAIDAIDYDVAAYLLKPVRDYSKFLKAVIKVRDRLEEKKESVTSDSIFVKVDSLFTHLALNDILWVEAFGDYVKINTDKKVFTVYSTMKVVEEKLPATVFMRVHRSFIVNVKKIDNIDQSNLQIDKKIIPISNSYREPLMKSLNML